MSLQPPRFIKDISSILKSAFSTLTSHPIIFLPFIFTAFIQLFVLEILYFIPQYPAGTLFGPLIRSLWGEVYLHYPSNFYLLPQLFQNVQIPISILIGSFFAAMAIAIIVKINNNQIVILKETGKEVFKQYVHIVIASLLAFLLVLFFIKGYDLIFKRALLIRSTSGIFYVLKRIVVGGGFYATFLFSVLTTTLMAYVLPVIVIEKKKIFTALWLNLKLLGSLFLSTFTVIFIFSLLFIPVFALKMVIAKGILAPDWTVVMIAFDVLAMMVINALIYTAITTIYLSKKEDSQ